MAKLNEEQHNNMATTKVIDVSTNLLEVVSTEHFFSWFVGFPVISHTCNDDMTFFYASIDLLA
jgi:hypothetical protein